MNGIDLTNLTPAPWQAGLDMPEVANNDPRSNILWHGSQAIAVIHSPWASDDVHCANAAFMALARNAFDVMMRRGWTPIRLRQVNGDYQWRIKQVEDDLPLALQMAVCAWTDPFTALCAADEWYKANVEKAP